VKTILGRLACEHCSRAYQHEEILGVVDGTIVTRPLILRNVIGRDRGLWKLACGHSVLKLAFTSPEEWLAGIRPEVR
jgi:hypothetical protein